MVEKFMIFISLFQDKNGNPPGILQYDIVDPLPHLLKVIIRRLVGWVAYTSSNMCAG